MFLSCIYLKKLKIITVDHTAVGWEGVERIDLAQDRDKWWVVVSAVIDAVVLQCGELLGELTVIFSRRSLLCGVR